MLWFFILDIKFKYFLWVRKKVEKIHIFEKKWQLCLAFSHTYYETHIVGRPNCKKCVWYDRSIPGGKLKPLCSQKKKKIVSIKDTIFSLIYAVADLRFLFCNQECFFAARFNLSSRIILSRFQLGVNDSIVFLPIGKFDNYIYSQECNS